MKIEFILVLALLSASATFSSAQSDEEILQFADSVLEIAMLSHALTANASISNDTLIMTGKFKPETNASTVYIGSAIYIMALASEKLIERYPNRFNATDLKLYDSKNTLVGEASIAAINA
jgi:hypothetical protein